MDARMDLRSALRASLASPLLASPRPGTTPRDGFSPAAAARPPRAAVRGTDLVLFAIALFAVVYVTALLAELRLATAEPVAAPPTVAAACDPPPQGGGPGEARWRGRPETRP